MGIWDKYVNKINVKNPLDVICLTKVYASGGFFSVVWRNCLINAL